MKHMILLHKTPAIWNKTPNIDVSEDAQNNDKKLDQNNPTDGLMKLLDEDIYIQCCIKLREKLGFDHLHIVQGFQQTEAKNWFVEEQHGQFNISENITYYSLQNPWELIKLPQADFVFSRGNYPTLHRWYLEQLNQPPMLWVHYPATASYFPHLPAFKSSALRSLRKQEDAADHLQLQIQGMFAEHQIPTPSSESEITALQSFERLHQYFTNIRTKAIEAPYDLVLIDDGSQFSHYSSIYPDAQVLQFQKPSAQLALAEHPTRQFDLLFCGTTLQPTKNHSQFLGLLDQLDILSTSSLKVGIVGNQGNLPAFTNGLRKVYQNIEVFDLGEVSREKLGTLFNQTRCLIVLSGRDCNPRVIQEAGLHGVRALVADTLSDGIDVIRDNPLLGSVIQTDKHSWFYQRNGNLLFDVDRNFAERVADELAYSFHPRTTSELANSIYSLESVVENLAEVFNLQWT